MGRYVVCITGASGAVLGQRTSEALLKMGHEVHAVVSDAAWTVMRYETPDHREVHATAVHAEDDIAADISSSSNPVDGVVVAPCSMNTLARIAHGFSGNLVERVAEIAFRTDKRIVVVPRETPLSANALENMLRLKRDGAIVLPPVVGYYARPKTIEDVNDFFVGKILDNLGLQGHDYERWSKAKAAEAAGDAAGDDADGASDADGDAAPAGDGDAAGDASDND